MCSVVIEFLFWLPTDVDGGGLVAQTSARTEMTKERKRRGLVFVDRTCWFDFVSRFGLGIFLRVVFRSCSSRSQVK